MAFDISNLLDPKEQITALYIGYFGRAPDPIGLVVWQQQLEESLDGAADGIPGRSLTEIATAFSRQTESQNEYEYFAKIADDIDGNETRDDAEAFINSIYLNIFDRPAEPGGLQNWTNKLIEGNLSVGEIILKIIQGAGPGDQARFENKVEAAIYFHDTSVANGITKYNSDPEVASLATTVTDGVTNDPATLDAALNATDELYNEAPVATDEARSTDEDTDIVDGDVSDNATDADGDDLTFSVAPSDGPANGTVDMAPDGSYTYTPGANYNGPDSFTYSVTDGFETTTATVFITVDSVNDAPVALPAAAATTENAVAAGAVSSTDVDGGVPNYSLSQVPAKGIVTMNPDGSFTFDPNGQFEGLNVGEFEDVTFEYDVADGNGGTDTGTVTVTVNGVDDAPVAQDESATVDESNDAADTIGGLLMATDVDNSAPITFALNGAAPAGLTVNPSGSYTFNPSVSAYNSLAEGETQVVSTTYTATSNGQTDTGTITITVTGTNDAPVALVSSATTQEDTAVSGTVSATDVDNGDALTYGLFTAATKGDVTVNSDGTFTYTPDADFNGQDSFVYVATDSEGATSTATVTIDVTAVDDAPVATNVTGSVDEGATPALSGTLVATDVDNVDALITYAVDTAVAGFSLAPNGDWEFDATNVAYNSLAEGETQVVSTTYTATSNGQTDTGTITITVTGTNDAPVATAVSVAGVEDTVAAGLAVATDVDNGDTLTYSVEAGDEPTYGDVTMNQNGSFEYTPDANFNGTDTFTYTVTDSQGATATAIVTVTVAAASDELTTGIDIFAGSVANDIVTGNENTLNSGDNVVGGEGEDTVIINVDTGVDTFVPNPVLPLLPPILVPADDFTFGGFSLDVETFQTTIDGEGSATFDMSGSEITGNTFVNSNSSADVTYNSVNMTAGGTNGDDNGDGLPDDLFSLELVNVTNSADTTVTTRPAQVSGTTDAANILATNVDSNAIIGDVNFFGAPGTTSASGIETFNLSTAGSPQPVVIEDLNTPGASNLNIAADTTGLTIGDNDNDVAISGDPFGQRDIDGFEFSLSSTINNVNGSASTGGFGLSLEAASGNVIVTGGDGDDTIEGSNNNDVISGGLGDDILDGDDGADIINGGVGNDTLLGSSGADIISGGDNNDVIEGGNGNDVLNGDAGNDNIHTGINAADEFVNAGADNDNVTTNVQFLDGTDENGGSLNLVDQLDGSSGFDNLFLQGSASTDVNGLNFVQGFENIELDGSGAQTFTIGNNSRFEAEHDTRVLGGGDETTVDGRTAGGSLNLNFTTLDAKMNVIDSVFNDTIVGSRGDDDIFFSTGVDNLVGGLGNDEFIGDPDNIELNDTIDGDSGDDTIVARGRGTANLGANIVGIETLKAEDTGAEDGADLTVNIGDGTAPNDFTNNDTTTTFHDGTASNGGNPRIHIDGSALDSGEELFVNFLNTIDEDIQVTGGASNDIVNMGTFLDAGDQIEGGLNSPVNVNSGVFGDVVVIDLAGGSLTDAALAGLSGIETLRVIDSVGGGTLTLGANAMTAGIQVVDASGVTTNGTTINATAFTNDLTVLDGPGNLTINTDGGNDTILLNSGTDNINTGGGADTIQIENGELDFSDTIEGGTGADTVVLMNNTGPAAGITANVDLTNVTGIENYTMEGDGNLGGGGFEADTHNINFQNGNVGTVTPILINSSNVLDTLDTLNVTLVGGVNAVDADFTFTVTGGAGVDTFTKNNFGLNNNIDWNGGEGQDFFSIAGGDLGASTTITGGDGVDTLEQLQGSFIDGDFINVSSMESLTVGGANTMLMATLGAEADEAGIVTIQGGSGNDNVLLDAAFENDLTVFMDNPLAALADGGDDTINGAASTSAITFVGTGEDFTASDQLTGGSGTGDVANIIFDGLGPIANVSNMNGVETINVQAPFGGGPFTLTLGNTTTDAADDALVINEAAFDFPPTGTSVGDQAFLGDTLNVQGATYTGDITYNGENDSAVSNVTTGSGDDLVNGGSLGDTLITNAGVDTVNGEAGDDNINSGADADTVDGGTGNDTIDGGMGDDSINGGANNDLITGGMGEDTLTGGSGADDFRYVTVSESQGIPNDIITDFETGVDEILIEENVLVQAGGGATSVAAAPLGFNAPSFGQAVGAISGTENDGIADWVFQAAAGGDPATLWIDTNDDGLLTGLDLQIELQGVTALQAGDVRLIDTILPAAPTIDSIADDTGAASDDFITQDDTLIVTIGLPTGAGDGTDAKAGDTLTVFHPGIAGDSTDITLTQVDIDAGEYAFDITGIPLADGDYDFSAQITDELGVPQAGPVSAVQTITVDNAATITIVDVANDGVDDGFINAAEDDAVVASGTTTDVEEGATVTVTFDDGSNPVVTGTATVDGSGNWAITAADNVDVSGLNEGNITVSAEVTDLAGNTANDSDVLVKDTLVTNNVTILEGAVINAAEEQDLDYTGNVSDHEGNLIESTFTGLVGGVLTTLPNPASPEAAGGGGIYASSPDISNIGGTGFDEGSVITLTTTVTDQAGNVAIATDTAVLDTTPPEAMYTFAQYDEGTGQITLFGTFNVADIDVSTTTSDFSAVNTDYLRLDDGDGGDAVIENTGFDANEITSVTVNPGSIVVQMTAAGIGEFEANGSIGAAIEDFIDLDEGWFNDINGNPSEAVDNLDLGLIISTAGQGSASIFGGSIDDTLTASNDGDTLTGNGGDDTFVVGFDLTTATTPALGASDGGTPPAFAMTITDLNVDTESDMIQFSGAALDAVTPGATDYDGGTTLLNFQTYVGGTATAATNQEGTIIYDAVNEQLRIDVNGDTNWTGANIQNGVAPGDPGDTGEDDIVIDLTGITGTLDASDFSIV